MKLRLWFEIILWGVLVITGTVAMLSLVSANWLEFMFSFGAYLVINYHVIKYSKIIPFVDKLNTAFENSKLGKSIAKVFVSEE